MEREGPGFLADLAFLWLTVALCIVVADVIDRQIGRPLGLLLAIGAAVAIAFCCLLAYYRIFLDERPLLGTASRTRFGVLLFQFVLVGFAVGVLLSPPAPFTLVAVAGVVVLGAVLSYWWVYRRDTLDVAQADP